MPAALLHSAGTVITSEKNDTAITAYSGTLSRLSRRNSAQPGIPRSRENAYQVREALVRPAATQKIWPTVAIRITSFAAQESMALVKIAIDAAAGVVDRADVVGREQEGQQDEPADQRREEHRAPDALRGGDRRAARLLGGVRRGVVAGLRVHRQQESQRQHQEPERQAAGRAAVEAGVVDPLAEHEAGVLVVVGDEDQQRR